MAGNSGFFSASSSRHSFYNEVKEDIIIDLGLSLGTSLQSQPYHPSGHFTNLEEHDELMGWPQLKTYTKRSNVDRPIMINDETEGIQTKERWDYVKVHMEGLGVGRKVCIADHAGYSSLSHQLENMFGRHSLSGLRLFEDESEFSLFYKNTSGHWRTAGDVPWKEFVNCAKRLKIARKDEAIYPSSSYTSQFFFSSDLSPNMEFGPRRMLDS